MYIYANETGSHIYMTGAIGIMQIKTTVRPAQNHGRGYNVTGQQ